VPLLRFGQDDIRLELSRVRCGLPTNHSELLGELAEHLAE